MTDLKKMFKKIIKIAHRGFRVGVDENTFDAFDTAVEYKMDFFECDVRKTKDGVLVIMHDDTVDRTFNGSGTIEEQTYKELKLLKSKKSGQNIPMAETTLKKYSSKIKLMMEIKGKGVDEDLAQLIKSLDLEDRVTISGRHPDEFKHVKKIIPNVTVCLNITKCKEFTPEDLKNCNKIEDLPFEFDMISLSVQKIDKKFVDKCNQFGIIPVCWNFLPEEDPYQKTIEMLELGVEGILFDHPSIIEKFRKNEL